MWQCPRPKSHAGMTPTTLISPPPQHWLFYVTSLTFPSLDRSLQRNSGQYCIYKIKTRAYLKRSMRIWWESEGFNSPKNVQIKNKNLNRAAKVRIQPHHWITLARGILESRTERQGEKSIRTSCQEENRDVSRCKCQHNPKKPLRGEE